MGTKTNIALLLVILILGTAIFFLYTEKNAVKEERNTLCTLSNNLIEITNFDSYMIYVLNPNVGNRSMLSPINCSEEINLK